MRNDGKRVYVRSEFTKLMLLLTPKRGLGCNGSLKGFLLGFSGESLKESRKGGFE